MRTQPTPRKAPRQVCRGLRTRPVGFRSRDQDRQRIWCMVCTRETEREVELTPTRPLLFSIKKRNAVAIISITYFHDPASAEYLSIKYIPEFREQDSIMKVFLPEIHRRGQELVKVKLIVNRHFIVRLFKREYIAYIYIF